MEYTPEITEHDSGDDSEAMYTALGVEENGTDIEDAMSLDNGLTSEEDNSGEEDFRVDRNIELQVAVAFAPTTLAADVTKNDLAEYLSRFPEAPEIWQDRVTPSQRKHDNAILKPYDLQLDRLAASEKEVQHPVHRYFAAQYIKIDCAGRTRKDDIQRIFYLSRTQGASFLNWIERYYASRYHPTYGHLATFCYPPFPEPARTPYVPHREIARQPEGPQYLGYNVSIRLLKNMENFLADEDHYRCVDFGRKLEEIKNYIKYLDANFPIWDQPEQEQRLRNIISDMIMVHDQWIEDELKVKPLYFSFEKFGTTGRIQPPASAGDITALEYMKEAMRRFIDSPLVFPVHKGPMRDARVTAPLEGNERPSEDDPYMSTRAMIRIRQREEALIKTFQAREKTLHDGDTSYTPAPMNFKGPYLSIPRVLKEEGMVAQQNELVELVRKLIATEKLAPRVALSEVLTQIDRGLCDAFEGQEDDQHDYPLTDEDYSPKPLGHVADETYYASPEIDRFRLMNSGTGIARKVLSATRLPTPPNTSTSRTRSPDVETQEVENIRWSNQDVDLLLVMTEPSWNHRLDELHFANVSIGADHPSNEEYTYDRMVSYARCLEQLFREKPELWPTATDSVSLVEITGLINGIGEYVFCRQEAWVYLKRMETAGRARATHQHIIDANGVRQRNPFIDEVTRAVQKPALTKHPESRFIPPSQPPIHLLPTVQYNGHGATGPAIPQTPSALPTTAFKLGRRIRELTIEISEPGLQTGEQEPNAIRLRTFLETAKRLPGDLTIEELAQKAASLPINNFNPTITPTSALQSQLLIECNRNWSQRSPQPDFRRLWSFCEELPPVKYGVGEGPALGDVEGERDFFGLDRWPLEVQTPERIARVVGSAAFIKDMDINDGLEVRGLKRKASDEDLDGEEFSDQRSWDERCGERWFRGETKFPFGETWVQQAWQSRLMDADMGDVDL